VKRVIAVIAVAAALAAVVAAAPASAAKPPDRRIAALEKQVKVLQAEVKVLRKTVDANDVEARTEAARNKVGDACIALAVADLFQSTWTTVSPSAFGPQVPLDDVSCKAIGVARPGIQSRPTVDVFWAITGWLIG